MDDEVQEQLVVEDEDIESERAKHGQRGW